MLGSHHISRVASLQVTRTLMTTKRWSSAIYLHRNTPTNNPSQKFTFSDTKQVNSIISKYPPQYKKAAVIPLLHLGQSQNDGWTSIGVMNEVANVLEMNPMRVYEVATFYTMFNRNPIGKFHVQVCTTTPCELCGASNLVKRISSELGISVGETTSDGTFTLGEVECAGACVNAPMMSVNDIYYEDLTPDRAIQILQEFKAGKNPIPGPQAGRKSCENSKGQTTLLSEPLGPGANVRSDL